MDYRWLGRRTGLRVSPMALGTGRLGTSPGRTGDRGVALETLAEFAEAGGNFIDTSSAYQQGQAEEMVGEFVAQAGRDRFVISSKYGRTAKPDPAPAEVGIHRAALRAEVEGSLKRLRTDRIDVYFPHFDDGFTPIEEIMRGLDDLVRAGKVIHLGLSNFPAWRIASAAMLAELRQMAPVAVLQLQYHLLERAIEHEHLPLARAHGMALMAWSPLAAGRLAGRTPEPADAVIAEVAAIAAELAVAPASVALAWLLAKAAIPVIGPRNPAQLGANLASVEISLTSGQIARLDDVSDPPAGYPYDLLAAQRERLGFAAGGVQP